MRNCKYNLYKSKENQHVHILIFTYQCTGVLFWVFIQSLDQCAVTWNILFTMAYHTGIYFMEQIKFHKYTENLSWMRLYLSTVWLCHLNTVDDRLYILISNKCHVHIDAHHSKSNLEIKRLIIQPHCVKLVGQILHIHCWYGSRFIPMVNL